MTEAELQQTLWSIITTEPVMLTNAHSALLSYQAAGGTRQQAERLLHQMNTATHGYNENAIYKWWWAVASTNSAFGNEQHTPYV